MNRKLLLLVGAIITIISASGCQESLYCNKQSLLYENWGRSFATARYMQTVNPEPVNLDSPVIGLDGSNSNAVIGNYHKLFQGKKAMPVTYNINIGDIGK